MSRIIPECSPTNCLRYGTIIEQVLYVFAITQNFLNFIFSLMKVCLDVNKFWFLDVNESWWLDEFVLMLTNLDDLMHDDTSWSW